mmetsp:Transcript_10406/g.22820  ORF Transcript_10406/g.22820 Transcript_10406/m.22820 type:complete len:286 (-) Transcript_10406:124-981(-)
MVRPLEHLEVLVRAPARLEPPLGGSNGDDLVLVPVDNQDRGHEVFAVEPIILDPSVGPPSHRQAHPALVVQRVLQVLSVHVLVRGERSPLEGGHDGHCGDHRCQHLHHLANWPVQGGWEVLLHVVSAQGGGQDHPAPPAPGRAPGGDGDAAAHGVPEEELGQGGGVGSKILRQAQIHKSQEIIRMKLRIVREIRKPSTLALAMACVVNPHDHQPPGSEKLRDPSVPQNMLTQPMRNKHRTPRLPFRSPNVVVQPQRLRPGDLQVPALEQGLLAGGKCAELDKSFR